jgi:hypothetical protein
MNKIILSENYFIIVKKYKKDLAAYLFEEKIVKAAKIFLKKEEREKIYNWGMAYLESKHEN